MHMIYFLKLLGRPRQTPELCRVSTFQVPIQGQVAINSAAVHLAHTGCFITKCSSLLGPWTHQVQFIQNRGWPSTQLSWQTVWKPQTSRNDLCLFPGHLVNPKATSSIKVITLLWDMKYQSLALPPWDFCHQYHCPRLAWGPFRYICTIMIPLDRCHVKEQKPRMANIPLVC